MRIKSPPDAAEAPGRASVNLEALLGDGDAQLVYEGLYRLRETKAEALGIVRAQGLGPDVRPFGPWVFGIPQIERLRARIGAAPVPEPLAASGQ